MTSDNRQRCEWCDAPAVTEVMIAPLKTRKVRGRKEITGAIWAPVCEAHKRMAYDTLPERNPRAIAAELVERRRKRDARNAQTTLEDFLG